MVEIQEFENTLKELEMQFLSNDRESIGPLLVKMQEYAQLLIEKRNFHHLDPNIESAGIVTEIFLEYKSSNANFRSDSTFANRFTNAIRRMNQNKNDENSYSAKACSETKSEASIHAESNMNIALEYFLHEIEFQNFATLFLYKMSVNVYLHGFIFPPLPKMSTAEKRKAFPDFYEEIGFIPDSAIEILRKWAQTTSHINNETLWPVLLDAYLHFSELRDDEDAGEFYAYLHDIIFQAAALIFSENIQVQPLRDFQRKNAVENLLLSMLKIDLNSQLETEDSTTDVMLIRVYLKQKIDLFPYFLENPTCFKESGLAFQKKLTTLGLLENNAARIFENAETPSEIQARVAIETLVQMNKEAIPYIIKLFDSRLTPEFQNTLMILLNSLHAFAEAAIPFLETFIQTTQPTAINSIVIDSAKRALTNIRQAAGQS